MCKFFLICKVCARGLLLYILNIIGICICILLLLSSYYLGKTKFIYSFRMYYIQQMHKMFLILAINLLPYLGHLFCSQQMSKIQKQHKTRLKQTNY